jgi:2-dehydropantoate 2-reductase
MRIVVLGAGGVGSVIGGYIARKSMPGIEVVMIARPGHTIAVQQNGLQLSGLESFRTPVPTVADATQIREADVVIITVKTKDMERSLAGIAHMQVGGVASLQNGVVKNEQIERVFGADKVIGATTMIGASLLRDGAVEYTLDGITFFGEMDGRSSERVQAVVHAFVESGLKASATNDIISVEWTKQAFQNPFAPIAAMTRLPMHRVWSSPQLARVSVHMFREVAALATAKGIALSDHPAWSLFNLEIMCNAPFEDAVARLVEVGKGVEASGRTHIIPSMLQDVLAAKKTEIEETVGYVYREGQRLGIPVPYTEFAYQTLKAIEDNFDGRVSELS